MVRSARLLYYSSRGRLGLVVKFLTGKQNRPRFQSAFAHISLQKLRCISIVRVAQHKRSSSCPLQSAVILHCGDSVALLSIENAPPLLSPSPPPILPSSIRPLLPVLSSRPLLLHPSASRLLPLILFIVPIQKSPVSSRVK